MAGLRHESFTVSGAAGTPDERSQEFVRAVDAGFLEPVRGQELEIAQLDRFRGDATLLTAVYDDAQPPAALTSARPVATFGDFVGSVCVRPGVTIPARMITEVTVRTSHRRRGILTSLMTSALRRAEAEGMAIAALTASEGGIYGRFGFGVAAFVQSATVRVPGGLRLRPEVAAAVDAAGIDVIVPDAAALPGLYEDAFAAFQEYTPGQIGHTAAYRRRMAGERNPWAMKDGDADWRPLVALGPDGAARGWAVTTVGRRDGRPVLVVEDFGAADAMAALALWRTLGATDLVESIEWPKAPVDSALPSLLVDRRDVVFGARHDQLWIRVLDVPAAFGARGLAQDGSLVLRVEDRLGHAAGDWSMSRQDGVTSVLRAGEVDADVPRLDVDAETLGSLLLGAVRVPDLVASGRAKARPADIAELTRLLAVERVPYNAYGF